MKRKMPDIICRFGQADAHLLAVTDQGARWLGIPRMHEGSCARDAAYANLTRMSQNGLRVDLHYPLDEINAD